MKKRIPKREAVFQFTLRGGTKVEVEGRASWGGRRQVKRHKMAKDIGIDVKPPESECQD